MILATVSTRNFDWTVVAPDEDAADAYLLNGYDKHVKQYPGADPDLMREMVEEGEVNYVELVVGRVLRDGEPL